MYTYYIIMLILFPHVDIYLPHCHFGLYSGKPQLVMDFHPIQMWQNSGRRILAGCVQDRLLARHGLQGSAWPVR